MTNVMGLCFEDFVTELFLVRPSIMNRLSRLWGFVTESRQFRPLIKTDHISVAVRSPSEKHDVSVWTICNPPSALTSVPHDLVQYHLAMSCVHVIAAHLQNEATIGGVVSAHATSGLARGLVVLMTSTSTVRP